MWRRKPVYKCWLCGNEVVAKRILDYEGSGYWVLPEGWTGEDRRYGKCLCDKCSNDIKEVRKVKEKPNGA